jgi:hypothetical protein
MGIILYDTAISATPLHLTKTDEEPGIVGEVRIVDNISEGRRDARRAGSPAA